jgi:hypothetical protein
MYLFKLQTACHGASPVSAAKKAEIRRIFTAEMTVFATSTASLASGFRTLGRLE